MTHEEATGLVRSGVTKRGGVWADLGAGSGTFTRALADLLGPAGLVYAVDRRPALTDTNFAGGAEIRGVQADFAKPLRLGPLDGVLMANSLHFVGRQERVLRQVVGDLVPGGTFLLVEYDLQRATPWIPYPVPPARFADLARRVGLSEPREFKRRPSRYGPRELYAAVAFRADRPPPEVDNKEH